MSEEQSQSNRKRFSSEEKFKIVKEHLTTKTPISEISKKHGVTPTSFYAWQEQFFSAALSGLIKSVGPKSKSTVMIDALKN